MASRGDDETSVTVSWPDTERWLRSASSRSWWLVTQWRTNHGGSLSGTKAPLSAGSAAQIHGLSRSWLKDYANSAVVVACTPAKSQWLEQLQKSGSGGGHDSCRTPVNSTAGPRCRSAMVAN
ncbi:hypothetical protein M6B38_341235 [Iris pallida]|uniref:Uncharacterized protein n=1 Tax=Iris pallida TaxID=29817 RepID=A0AAX6GWK9_IRIPA|nr:hypothetical protein M6B38_341235 [Iris pallida]